MKPVERGEVMGLADYETIRDRFLVMTNRFRPALMIVSEIPERHRGVAG